MKSISIECHKCKSCGNVTLDPRNICPKCGGNEIEATKCDGKGKAIDFTTVYFPPDDYKDLSPYTSILVQLSNGLKLFGIVRGEHTDIPFESPVTAIACDEARGFILFGLGQ
jgi:uncharacterized protein